MLPVRRLLPPVRLRRRRRHHDRRRVPPAAEVATGLTRRWRRNPPQVALLIRLAVLVVLLGAAPAGATARAEVAAAAEVTARAEVTAPAGATARAEVAAAAEVPTRAEVTAEAEVAARRTAAAVGRRQPTLGAYIPPVDGPVVDPFRPPAGRYAPGNRGLEYDTVPGDPVWASADGTVTFAGPVGGTLHVTVLHPDGVRTSYSFLAAVEVVLGQQVRQGDHLGASGERLHFGARTGDSYFDPAALFAGALTTVELLPLEVPPGSTPDAEARALADLTMGEGGFSLPGFGGTLDWLRARALSGMTYATQLNPVGRGLDVASDLADRILFPAPCSAGPAPDRPVAGQRRVAITVAGLGSSSDTATIDALRVADLGYERDRVVRFSYAGGRTPSTGAAFAGIDAHEYESDDTQGDIVVAATRLADLVEQVAAAAPDAVLDIFAHSLGGLVTRLALADLDRRGFDVGRLGLVTTLASPHQGADAATAVVAANSRLAPNLLLDAAQSVVGTGLDPDATVIGQLAEHSDVVADLAAAGVPVDVQMLSLAARGDLVVASPRTEVAGAVNVTVPVAGLDAHGRLVTSDAATAEMARALAGQDPGCESWGDAVADVVTGHTISALEDHMGAAAATVGW